MCSPMGSHYVGCACHESTWAEKLAAAEASSESYRLSALHEIRERATAHCRAEAAEARALCLEGERDAWQRSCGLAEERADASGDLLRRIGVAALLAGLDGNDGIVDGVIAGLNRLAALEEIASNLTAMGKNIARHAVAEEG